MEQAAGALGQQRSEIGRLDEEFASPAKKPHSGFAIMARHKTGKALNPQGSWPSHPRLREQTGRMWIGGSSKIARTAEEGLVFARLFGSGFAGLGAILSDLIGSILSQRRLGQDCPNRDKWGQPRPNFGWQDRRCWPTNAGALLARGSTAKEPGTEVAAASGDRALLGDYRFQNNMRWVLPGK
jgi:hypothetical protein